MSGVRGSRGVRDDEHSEEAVEEVEREEGHGAERQLELVAEVMYHEVADGVDESCGKMCLKTYLE